MICKFATNRACLRCSAGAQTADLVLADKNVYAESEQIATESDAIPILNIPSFGICSHTKQPCVPVTVRWEKTHESVRINDKACVTDKSVLPCAIGGLITIESVPQDSVMCSSDGEFTGY